LVPAIDAKLHLLGGDTPVVLDALQATHERNEIDAMRAEIGMPPAAF